MNDILSDWLFTLGRTTLVLAVAAVLAAVVLRLARAGSPRLHRAAWCLVLLAGWLFVRLPVAIPWYEPPQTEPRPSASGNVLPPQESPQYSSATDEVLVEIGPGAVPKPANSTHLAPIATLPAEEPQWDEPKSSPPRNKSQSGNVFNYKESLSSEASTPPKTILAKKAASTPNTFVVATPPNGASTSARGGLSSYSRVAPWIAVAWSAGLVLAVLRWLAGYVRSIRAMSTAIEPDDASCRQWKALLAEHGVARDIPLRLTTRTGPLLCRWPDGYELVVPAELWRSLDPAARESIMRHELAHYQRGDVWKSLAMRVLALPHWFNPAAWWAVRRFEEAAEWACDEAAVARGQKHTEFARTLVTLAEASLGGPPWADCHPAVGRWNLSARIRRLLDSSHARDSIMKKLALGTLALLLVAICLVRVDLVAKTPTVEPPTQSEPQPAGTRSVASAGHDTAPSATPSRVDLRAALDAQQLGLFLAQLSQIESNLRTLRADLTVARAALQRLDNAPVNTLELQRLKLDDPTCRELQKKITDLQAAQNQSAGKSKEQSDRFRQQILAQMQVLQAYLDARLTTLTETVTEAKRNELKERIEELAIKVDMAADERANLEKTIKTLREQLEKASPPATPAASAAWLPHEGTTASLPTYRIEPPDILEVELLKMVPKEPYRIERFDVLKIDVLGTLLDQPINNNYLVDGSGKVTLGPAYGKAEVAGLTIDEAQDAVRRTLMKVLKNPEVAIELSRAIGLTPIKGPYLVGPDGTINLRQYGSIHVSGKTLEEAKKQIEKHLATRFASPEIAVDVASYNSKVYYVIVRAEKNAQSVLRVPNTGKETVLDAVAQLRGLRILPATKIWVARPKSDGSGTENLLPVNFDAIAEGRDTRTNYQLMPGDRVFVDGASLVASELTTVNMAASGRLSVKSESPAQAPPENLRYEGRSFDQWKTSLESELSPDRRIEAIRALAAFGARGNGKEAADAILRLTRECGYSGALKTDAGRMSSAAMAAFCGHDERGGNGFADTISIADGLGALCRELNDGNDKSRNFVLNTLRQLGPKAADAAPALAESIGGNLSPESSRTALWALLAIDPSAERFASALRACIARTPDPQMAAQCLQVISTREIHFAGGSPIRRPLRLSPRDERLLALLADYADDPKSPVRPEATYLLSENLRNLLSGFSFGDDSEMMEEFKASWPALSIELRELVHAALRRLMLGYVNPDAKQWPNRRQIRVSMRQLGYEIAFLLWAKDAVEGDDKELAQAVVLILQEFPPDESRLRRLAFPPTTGVTSAPQQPWWQNNGPGGFPSSFGRRQQARSPSKPRAEVSVRSPGGPNLVGQKTEFMIQVGNHTGIALTNVKVQCSVNEVLRPTLATPGFKMENDDLIWTLDSWPTGQTRKFRIQCENVSAEKPATCHARLTSAEGVEGEDTGGYEIRLPDPPEPRMVPIDGPSPKAADQPPAKTDKRPKSPASP